MNVWKKIPEVLGSRYGRQAVVSIEAKPPGTHPDSPIVDAYTCVICTLADGHKRYFGTCDARIGSDPRMHIVINPRDEVLARWEESDNFYEEAPR